MDAHRSDVELPFHDTLGEKMLGHRSRTAAPFIALVALAACTYHPSRFPLYGATDDRTRLAGEWIGEFEVARSGRSGSISFHLEAGRDSASGDVSVLAPYVGNAQPRRYDERGPSPRFAAGATLRIRDVSVGASIVEGSLEPFRDAECDCSVTTWFRGEVHGDSIVGEFVSRGGFTKRRGEWRMSRR
jgi:hypothetical protein